MKRFDELSQDQQMDAVDDMADSIIFTTLDGIVLPCFANFTDEIDQVFDQAETHPAYSIEDVETPLRFKIENTPAMKLSLLHEAGRMAQVAFYIEDDDLVVRLYPRN